jgi:hypothetical protein
MSFLSPKNLIKHILALQGYEISLHKIAKSPYIGPKVAFIHIAKCGGSSVDFALRSALAGTGERRIDKKASIVASMTSFNQGFPSMEKQTKGYSEAFSEHHARHLQKVTEYYLQLQWQYISGHVTINSALLKQYQQEYAFITILRDPVERFISNYIFNKLTNSTNIMLPNNIHTNGSDDHSTDNIISEAKNILTSQRGWQMANSPSMYITGRYPQNADDAKSMQAEVAENLALFKVVGFLDNLTAFEKDCSALTGREIKIGQRNSINSAMKNNGQEKENAIKSTLKEFFKETSTIKEVNKLCQFEMENYLKIKDKNS